MSSTQKSITSLSPSASHLAVATKSKFLDLSFSSDSSIVVQSTSSRQSSNTVKSEYKFNSVIFCSSSSSHKQRLVALQEQGSFSVYELDCEDGLRLAQTYTNNNTLLQDTLAASFNASKGMLALSSPTQLILFNVDTLKTYSSGITPAAPLTALSWNPKVGHILAGGTENGEVIIYDLKNKREVIKLNIMKGSSTREITGIEWHWQLQTTLLVSSSGGLFLLDLSTNKCDKKADFGTRVAYNSSFIFCTDLASCIVVLKKSDLEKVAEIKIDQSLCDFSVNDNQVALSYVSDSYEVLDIDVFMGRGGIVVRDGVFCISNNIVITREEKYRIEDLSPNEELNDKIDALNITDNIREGENEMIIQDEDVKLLRMIKNQENTEEFLGSFKKEYKINEKVTLPTEIFTKILNNTHLSIEDHKKINNTETTFILSRHYNDYEYLINNGTEYWANIIEFCKEREVLEKLSTVLLEKNMTKEALITLLLNNNFQRYFEIKFDKIERPKTMKEIEELMQYFSVFAGLLIDMDVKMQGELIKFYVRWCIKKGENEKARKCVGDDDLEMIRHFNLHDKVKGVNGINGSMNRFIAQEQRSSFKLSLQDNNFVQQKGNVFSKPTSQNISLQSKSMPVKTPTFQSNNTIQPKTSVFSQPKNIQSPLPNIPIQPSNSPVQPLMSNIPRTSTGNQPGSNNIQKKNIGTSPLMPNIPKTNNSNPLIMPNLQINNNPGSPIIPNMQRNNNFNSPIMPNMQRTNIPTQPQMPNMQKSIIPQPNMSSDIQTNAEPQKRTYGMRNASQVKNIIGNQKVNNVIPNIAPKPNIVNSAGNQGIAMPKKTQIQPPFSQNVAPSPVMQKNEEMGGDKTKILASIDTKINLLISQSQTKKGILLKNKISNAIKRIEYYQGIKSNIDYNVLMKLDEILALADKENFQKMKMQAEDVVRSFSGCGVEIFVPGMVSLAQVVISDK